jgi:hypothetical protein
MSQIDGYYQEGRQEIARNLKSMGVPLGQIAQGTRLTEEQVKAL